MKRILLLALAIVLAHWALANHTVVFQLIKRLFSIINPLVAGAALAFILNVPMRSLERRIFVKGKPVLRRAFSLITTLLMVIVLVGLILLIVIPELVVAIESLATQMPAFIDRVKQLGDDIAGWLPDTGFWSDELDISWEGLKKNTLDLLKNSSAALVGSTLGLASSMVSGVVNFILGLIFACYMLIRKEQLTRQFKRLLNAYVEPNTSSRVLHAGSLVNTTFSKFVAGACTEAVILGLMFLVAMLLFSFPYAVLVSALVSVAALIPIVGAFVALFVGVLLMLVSDPMQAFWFLVLFLVLQQIEGNFIYPRVVGDSIGLPALWVLAAVMVGGKLFGVLGMLAAVPSAAVAYVLIRESITLRGERKSSHAATDGN
jgi:predicted PurR-regulated permease PerM